MLRLCFDATNSSAVVSLRRVASISTGSFPKFSAISQGTLHSTFREAQLATGSMSVAAVDRKRVRPDGSLALVNRIGRAVTLVPPSVRIGQYLLAYRLATARTALAGPA